MSKVGVPTVVSCMLSVGHVHLYFTQIQVKGLVYSRHKVSSDQIKQPKCDMYVNFNSYNYIDQPTLLDVMIVLSF